MTDSSQAFWSNDTGSLLQKLGGNPGGLTSDESHRRLARFGPNLLKAKKRTDALTLLLGQFKTPIILILLAAAILSYFLHDRTDAIIIISIVLISGLLGFWQEKGAADAIAKLLSIVQTKTTVLRDGTEAEIPVEEIIPGDILILSAGAVIPGDCRILESKDLFIDEATLTGETFPVEKMPCDLPDDTPLAKRSNSLFMGTHVVSGSSRALVVKTGIETEFGQVSKELKLRPPETEFERGIRRFGYFLLEITLLLVITIFALNVYFHRPVFDSFLFALALAVGLTPQLLPAIISVNLAHGAKRLADNKVIVRRLASIENFGSMRVLCSDKTGTITAGKVQVNAAFDYAGKESEKALQYAYVNASYESGFTNPIDEAIRNFRKFDLSCCEKFDEIPYDFIRKRLSVVVKKEGSNFLITKGALQNVMAVCTQAEGDNGKVIDIAAAKEAIQKQYEDFSARGLRTLGIAYRHLGEQITIGKEHEEGMTFLGFLTLYDPHKPGISETIEQLRKLGIRLKIITGDNRLVAASVSKQVGISDPKILTGPEMRQMSDEALIHKATTAHVFAEIEPNQKERIILALKKGGSVVGFIGDGINDASALHAADVGISVASAVDVAKEAADIVLLEQGLDVLVQGVREGRRTFANTLKYVFMATSANFGNMFSMAGASLFLPFLPLLPTQILLTNMLTDFPEMAIATDNVDPEMVEKPRRWNIKFIRTFMLTFGPLSSVFDFLTFGALLLMMHADVAQFRTGWFMESVISASMVVLVVRSRRSFLKSRPGKYLAMATFFLLGVTIILPYTSVGSLFQFTPLPVTTLLMLAGIVVLYILFAELAKKLFYRWTRF